MEAFVQPTSNRKSANLFLDESIVSQARGLNINLSRAAEYGIALAVKAERERLWRSENAKAISEMNEYVEQNGLPLAKYRLF